MSGGVTNIFFCGTGGQGILTAAEICGMAALLDGHHVKKSEVHGMAQRGGSVESHVRFGAVVYSPLIPYGAIDYLVPFHTDEHARFCHELKPGGVDLVRYLDHVATYVEDLRYGNTFLLGVLSSYLSLHEEAWMRALEATVKPALVDKNKTYFLLGKKVRNDLE